MLASTRSPNSVRTISGKGAVFIEARVTEVTHHKGRIYVRSFTQLTFYTTESLGGLRNKRSTYMCRRSGFWKSLPDGVSSQVEKLFVGGPQLQAGNPAAVSKQSNAGFEI